MTLGDLIANARTLADDLSTPALWKTVDLIDYANEAEQEACRRARLIVDSTNAMTSLAIDPTTVAYALDPRILFVRRAKLATRARPLTPVHIADLDERFLGWEADIGEPRHFIKDMDVHAIRLYPKSTINDTLALTVVRLPLANMVADADKPEIRSHLHRSLIFWMLYRMYSKMDADTHDEKRAGENLALFEAEFGKKSGAIDEAWLERNHGYIDGEGIF